jgi:hypothetical protein
MITTQRGREREMEREKWGEKGRERERKRERKRYGEREMGKEREREKEKEGERERSNLLECFHPHVVCVLGLTREGDLSPFPFLVRVKDESEIKIRRRVVQDGI